MPIYDLQNWFLLEMACRVARILFSQTFSRVFSSGYWQERSSRSVHQRSPALGPVASPSGLCPWGRYASKKSHRVWAGGTLEGVRPQPHCRYCCHGPVAPKEAPHLQPSGGRPQLQAQTQPPGPGARLHGHSHHLLPGPMRVSHAFSPSSGHSPLGGSCSQVAEVSPHWKTGETDGSLGQ